MPQKTPAEGGTNPDVHRVRVASECGNDFRNAQLMIVGHPPFTENLAGTIQNAHLNHILVVLQSDKNLTIIHARRSCLSWAIAFSIQS